MSNRIFIGKSGSRTLFRISPPGYDADNLSGPSSFSSEGDYLQLHHIIDEPLARMSHQNAGITAYQHYGTWEYPSLGYLPFVFMSTVHSTPALNGRVFFPGDNNPATTEARNDINAYITNNRIWVGTNFPNNGFAGNYRVRMLIFKNRADEVF